MIFENKLYNATIKSFFVCILTFNILSVVAQQNSVESNKRILPVPSNVASLLKFTEIPINTFNGTANVSIPIYQLSQGVIDIPINLNYHTGGIKATEEASWVGLGWNLDVGGVIQENIVGSPDDITRGFSILQNNGPRPYSSTSSRWNTPTATNLTERGLCYRDSSGNVVGFDRENIVNGNFEYDMFSYNFNGHAGKFIMPDGSNAVQLDRQNIKITKSGAGLLAITPDGVKYFFDVVGYAKPAINDCTASNDYNLWTRTWYLSKIIYTNKKELNFTYTKTVSRSLPLLTDSWNYTSWSQNAVLTSSGVRTTSASYSTIDNFYLNEITFNNGKIKFIASNRIDLENGLKLDEMQIISNGSAVPIKRILFSYDYFIGSGDSWRTKNLTLSCSANYTPTDDQISKRLRLTKATVSDGTLLQASHAFSYNSVFSLPLKTTLGQDLWGYFNGAASNFSLIPNYNNIGFWDATVPYTLLDGVSKPPLANRGSSQNALAGTLKGIRYPTGGYTGFNYELNTMINLNERVGSNTIVSDNSAAIRVVSSGVKQVAFTIPSIGYSDPSLPYEVNPSQISIRLWCCGYQQGSCANAGSCGIYDPLHPTWGLYALLERFDPIQNQWILDQTNIFDYSKQAVINANGLVELPILLRPGNYRISANWGMDAGALNGREATISVKYKVMTQSGITDPNVKGGGLRIARISQYDKTGASVSTKTYKYTGGQAMTKPRFFRVYSSLNEAPSFSANCAANTNNSGCVGSDDCPVGIVRQTVYSLSSYPIAAFSYSAQGSLIGYSRVEVTDDANGTNGKVAYDYNCTPDHYRNQNAFTPIGVPTSPDFLNGYLIKQTNFKKIGNTYLPVNETNYTYRVDDFAIKWCFLFENKPDYELYGSQSQPLQARPVRYESPFFLLHFYPIKLGKVNLISKTEREYFEGGISSIVTSFDYNLRHQLRRSTTINSKGKSLTKETYYPSDYSISTGVLAEMKARNLLNYPIESITRDNGLAIEANYTEYSVHDDIITPLRLYSLPILVPRPLAASNLTNNFDSSYELKTLYNYDANGNLKNQKQAEGILTHHLWDYSGVYPIAEIKNAFDGDFAYTSFEAESSGNWIINSALRTDNLGFSGIRSYNLANGTISKNGLTSGKSYILSYWSRSGSAIVNGNTSTPGVNNDGWVYFEHRIAANISTVVISGAVTIDELRLFAIDAELQTIGYQPLVGMTSSHDVKNQKTNYAFDSFLRLKYIKNQNGDIIKSYDYSYNNQFENLTTVYQNSTQTLNFTKNNCTTGVGTEVPYSVASGQYSSNFHPGEANELALEAISATGQNNANTNGACVTPPCTTPIITSVENGPGLTVTINYQNVSSGASGPIISVFDADTNQQVYGQGGFPPNVNSLTLSVPSKNRNYKFTLMVTGGNCAPSITSAPYSIFLP